MALDAVCGQVGAIWVLEGWGMGERLTKRVIDAALPTGRDTFLFDTDIKGFALKITAGGKKVFTYQGRVAGEKIRVTIGPYQAVEKLDSPPEPGMIQYRPMGYGRGEHARDGQAVWGTVLLR
jgi:hypothetical protein